MLGEYRERLLTNADVYISLVPIGEVFAAGMTPGELDSLDQANSFSAIVPPGVDLPPFDAEVFSRDERLNRAMLRLVIAQTALGQIRNAIRNDTVRLREHVEAVMQD